MGLFSFTKLDISDDPCLADIRAFIKATNDIERKDVPMSRIYVDKKTGEIVLEFMECGNSDVCGYKNMLYRGQVNDEETIDRMIGKAMNADAFPKNTKVLINFNEEKNEYDMYKLLCTVKPAHKKFKLYADRIVQMCNDMGIRTEVRETSVHLHFCKK